MRKKVLFLGISTLLTGCLRGPDYSAQRANALYTEGWTGPTTSAQKKAYPPVCCYQTLGEVQCYERCQPVHFSAPRVEEGR